MKPTGTKKPCSPPRSQGFNTTNHHKGSISMTSLALSFNDVNFTPVQQENQTWITSRELGQALGYSREDAVNKIFERNSEEFTGNMSRNVKLTLQGQTRDVRIFSLRGAHLVAMFARTAIAKQFRKWVLDILDREVLGKQIESRQSVSPEQQALLHEIVARRSSGERKIFAEMWSRHNRHFKIARYSQLLAIHFPEAIHYLETMDIKAKVEKQELKALPYPQEVVQIAQKISQEFKGGSINSWFVNEQDGILSVMPLPHGYYPFNVKEFTKHFDGVLNVLYGSDILQLGRYMQKQG